MSNSVGVAIALSNVAIAGALIFAGYKIQQSANNLERKFTETQQAASDRLRNTLKGLI